MITGDWRKPLFSHPEIFFKKISNVLAVFSWENFESGCDYERDVKRLTLYVEGERD